MNNDLSHMVCLVAGGAGGIGREACLELVARGATVVAAGVPGQSIDSLRRELGALPLRHTIIEADLRFATAWTAVVEQTLAAYGRIDVLVNCAGLLIPGTLDALGPETLHRMIDVNLTAVVFGARAVVPVMRRQRHGHIITVGSLGGILPMPYQAVYSATKFAVRGFSLSLGHELRPAGIAVSLVSPGPVHTRMLVREAADDHGAPNYALMPMAARRVARAIVRAIDRPRAEAVIPRLAGRCAALLAAFPALLGAVQPLLGRIGRRNLRRYRRLLPPAVTSHGAPHAC